MNTDQMKQRLVEVYPGKDWEAKVKKMSDGQVVAIFRRLQAQNKIK